MSAIVECHSGYDYAEKPIALTYLDQRLEITIILAQGRTPEEKWFRVRTSDGQLFRLSYRSASDEWQIEKL